MTFPESYKIKTIKRNNAIESQTLEAIGTRKENRAKVPQNKKTNSENKARSNSLKGDEEKAEIEAHIAIEPDSRDESYENLGCLHEWFSRECPRHYDKTAVYFEGQTQTFRDLDHNSTLIAAWLQIEAKIQLGDMSNSYFN